MTPIELIAAAQGVSLTETERNFVFEHLVMDAEQRFDDHDERLRMTRDNLNFTYNLR